MLITTQPILMMAARAAERNILSLPRLPHDAMPEEPHSRVR